MGALLCTKIQQTNVQFYLHNILQIQKIQLEEQLKNFGISKSTVHKDVSERLVKINKALSEEVRKILDENKAERHIRGGMATKLKYENEKKKK